MDIAKHVSAEGTEGIANWIAASLEADGQYEAAAAVRESSDVIEERIKVAVDATACFGSVAKGAKRGAALGSLVPGVGTTVGALVGSAAGAAVNPSCWKAAEKLVDTAEEIAAGVVGNECSGSAVLMTSPTDCIDHCEAQSDGW